MENQKAKAKVGDKIVIKGLAVDPNYGTVDPRATDYIGKIGVVESVNALGDISGTWGSLSLLPTDDYEVLQEGETVHTFDDYATDTTIFILPRQLQELIEAVYTCANANCDCNVDGHSYIGC